MIVVNGFAGKRVAVLGLARSGRAAAEALAAGGATVLAWDDNPEAREAVAGDIPLYDLTQADCATHSGASAVARHPAQLSRAASRRRPRTRGGDRIIGDIELLGRARSEASYIGITGTNGKSTTTALIGHILATAGRRVEVGGHLGTAACRWRRLARMAPMCSRPVSFQLELIPSLPSTSPVLLNITPTISTGMATWMDTSPRNGAFSRVRARLRPQLSASDDPILSRPMRGAAARSGANRAESPVERRSPAVSMSIRAGSSTDGPQTGPRPDLPEAERTARGA